MIFGHIQQIDIDNADRLYPSALARTLRYLANTDFSHFEKDSRHEIVPDKIFATVAENMTNPSEQCKPEVHRDFADIHFLLEGKEQIGICTGIPSDSIIEDYFETIDIAFFPPKMRDDCQLYLSPGHFAFIFPGEIHRPLCAVNGNGEMIRKVIVKIATSCFF